MLKNLNKCKKNLVKALVLIDATGSMGKLLETVKNTISLYFDTMGEKLTLNKYEADIFKLQIAFYRNYSSGPLVLQKSEWVGTKKIEDKNGTEESKTMNDKDDIKVMNEFLKNIKESGGQGCEAVEIGLWHANNEINNPEDGVPVSLIFVFGDAPGNANINIINLKRNYIDKKDSL
jgi:hypothetical protein